MAYFICINYGHIQWKYKDLSVRMLPLKTFNFTEQIQIIMYVSECLK